MIKLVQNSMSNKQCLSFSSSSTANSLGLECRRFSQEIASIAKDIILTKAHQDTYANFLEEERQLVQRRKQFVADTFEEIKPALQHLIDNFETLYPELHI